MKKLSSVWLVAAVVSTSAWAQLPPLVISTQPYQSLVGATALPFTAGQDEGAIAVTLPFPFPYFGQTYTTVYPSINGFLTFGAGCFGGSACYDNTSLPSAGSPNAVIAAMWDDMQIATSPTVSQVRYLASGNEMAIEWYQIQRFSSAGSMTFMIRLRSDGAITIHHGPSAAPGTIYTFSLGIENQAGTQGMNLLPCTSGCAQTDFIPNRMFTLGEPNAPELAVSSVTIENLTQLVTGNLTMDVKPVFRNFGRQAANNFMWRAYLSRDQLLDTTATDGGADIDIGEFGPLSLDGVDGGVGLDGGPSIVAAVGSAGTSSPPAPGEYFVLVKADSTDVVVEASEGNNVGSTLASFMQGVDVIATSVSGPATSGGGNVENISVSFNNRGSTAAGSVPFRILLSTDQVYDVGDFELYSSTRTITGGQTISESIPVTIPQGAPNGTFYYLLQIDPMNVVTEANELNNVASSTARVEIRRADLLAETIRFLDPITGVDTTRANFGEAVRLKIKFRNNGGANANNFRVGLILSSDSSLSLLSDTRVCDQTVTTLTPASPSMELQLDCNLPLTKAGGAPFTTGSYYLFGVVDSTGAVYETNKANNSLQVGPVRITEPGPDLTVTALTAPSAAGVGEVIPVLRTLRNLGNLDSPAVAYRFYASANDIITTDDVLLPIVVSGSTHDEGMVTLSRGGTDTATELVKLPASIPAGTYYVGCIIDPQRVITRDLDPVNNALASRTMVVAPSSLRVVNTSLPDAIIGRPYVYRLSAAGEQGTSTWRIDPTLGSAPSWMSIGMSDGVLTGTPSGSNGAEVVGLTVVVENAGRSVATRLALRVLPTTAGLEITSTSLPAVVNSPSTQYQFNLGASGGVMPYTWRLVGGSLPSGLTLNADGVLAGAPRGAVNGNTPVTVEVRDSVGIRVQRQLTLRLIAPGAITFKTVAIGDALVGVDYIQDIAVSNQDGSSLQRPLSWRVTGEVPSGLAVTPQAELISVTGRPTQAGTFSFTISVEDNNGRTDSLEFTITVHPPRYRILAQLPELLRPLQTVSVQLTASPNTSSATFRVMAGPLPPGLTLEPNGVISGTVAGDGAEGTWSFVVEARDPAGMSGLTPMSLRVERESRGTGCSSTSGEWSPALVAVLAVLVALRRKAGKSALAVAAGAALVAGPALADYQVVGPTSSTYQPLTSGISSTAGTAISVPFSMPFFDTQFNTVAMSQYGYLAIGSMYASASTNQIIPHSTTSTFIPATYIAPWWDTLTTPTSYRYLVSGTAPNRTMAFEWNGSGANTSTTRIAFQVILYETTGHIRFMYSAALPGSVSASVGIQKAVSDGLAALTCSSTANCSSTNYPAGQIIDYYLPADLEITALSAPQSGFSGVPFPITATVRNRGGREATGVAVRFYLSTDATLDTSTDSVIGTASITTVDALSTAQATLNSPLPGSLTQSSYYLFAVVDPDRLISEQLETNNTSPASVVTIGPPTADLVVTAFQGPTMSTPGAMVQLTRTLQNIGNADSVAGKYTYFLSDNASVSIADRTLAVASIAVMTPNEVNAGMDTVAFPADLSPGTYWLGVCVNYDGSTSSFGGSEITIVNNCFTQSTGIQISTSTVSVTASALPMATQYAPFGARLTATGGNGTYAWALTSGELPPGVTLSALGDLVGTPSRSGTFSFEAKVTSGGATDAKTLTLQVAQGGLPLVIVDQTLTAAEFGRTYTVPLVAVGGKPPYTWRAVDPSMLPAGLGVASDGLLEGRPVGTGQFEFGVEVKDSEGTTVSKELALRVVTPTGLAIATAAVEEGSLGRQYLQPLVAIGGTAPYRWSLIRFQELPETITDAPGPVIANDGQAVEFPRDFGLDIDDRDTADYLSGTPRRAGLFSLTFKVRDGADTEDTASVLLHVTYRDGLAITTLSLPDAFVGQPYQVRLTHNGGSDAVGVAFSAPCIQQAVRSGEFQCTATEPFQRLPVGINLAVDGTVLGTPLTETGVYTFLVRVIDSGGRQDVRALAIRVRPDFALERSSCSSVGLEPSLILLALSARLLRRRRS